MWVVARRCWSACVPLFSLLIRLPRLIRWNRAARWFYGARTLVRSGNQPTGVRTRPLWPLFGVYPTSQRSAGILVESPGLLGTSVPTCRLLCAFFVCFFWVFFGPVSDRFFSAVCWFAAYGHRDGHICVCCMLIIYMHLWNVTSRKARTNVAVLFVVVDDGNRPWQGVLREEAFLVIFFYIHISDRTW